MDRRIARKGRQAAVVSLPTLFWLFLRIACTSFGGFMAMIAMVQNAVVERRRLLTAHAMLDGVSLASILPGPAAVNTVVYVGFRLRGIAGAWVSACAVVLPAFLFIVVLSWAYFRWGEMPAVNKLFMGFVPAVAAIIAVAARTIARQTIANGFDIAVCAASAALLLGVGGFFSTLAVVVGAGAAGYAYFFYAGDDREIKKRPRAVSARPRKKRKLRRVALSGAPLSLLVNVPLMVAPLSSFEPTLLAKLFFLFAAMSLLLFGGAYVFIPLMQDVVVQGQGWVTDREFIDAVALGQITPGPVLVSAAFIGLKVAGIAGAVAATAGIFIPSAVLMVLCAGMFDRVKHSPRWRAIMRGIRPAIVGMIAAAAVTVAQTMVPAWPSVLIFLTTLIALLRFRLEAVWIVPPAGLIGLGLY